MALTQISTEGIKNGTITNADIGSSAAIAGSKINPSFGSQTISLVSDQTNPSIQISGSGPNFIRFLDSSGALADSIDVVFRTSSHRLRFENASNGANILSLDVDDKQATFGGNVDIASGLDVTGNTIGTGKLQYTHTGVSNTAHFLFEGTQSTGTNNNGTFFEIKHGRGAGNTNPILDVKNSVGSVFSVTGTGQANMSGNLDVGAGIDVTGNITVSGTVDGRDIASDGSKLDTYEANGSSYLRSDAVDSSSANITINGLEVGSWVLGAAYRGIFHTSQSGGEYMMISQDEHTFISATTGYSVYIRSGGNDATNQLVVGSGNNALTWRGNKIFHAGNDGSGSGLDSDTVDGIQASSFLRSDADDTLTGDLTLNGRLVANHGSAPATGANYFFSDDGSTTTIGTAATLRVANNGGNAAYSVFEAESGSGSIRLANDGQFYVTGASKFSNSVRVDKSSTVDGFMGEAYGTYFGLKHTDQTYNSEYMILSKDTDTFISATSGYKVRIRAGGNDSTNELQVGSGNDALTWRGNKVFHAGNDGSGSGLDSDTVDGIQGASFARSDQDDTMSGSITLSKDATDVINFSANSSNNSRGIAFNGRTALSAGGSNAWLRLNNASEFTNGTYTPGLFRADGGFLTGTGSHRLAIKFDGTFSDTSVGHNASHNEGIFWHNNASYGIYRTAGNWSGNYQQLRLDWPTGIVIDGGTQYGLSGCRFDCHAYPTTNNTFDLGTSSLRWRNVYTNDLNLSNEGGSNDVDGTWGSYTIQEGAEDLFLVNKRNGKKYKFNLTEV